MTDTSASLFQRLRHEPLLQFLLLGLLIFLLAEWQAARSDQSDRSINVDQAMVSYLQNLYSVQFGYYPDDATLEQIINSHVRDEVLFREAVKLGLAQDDEIIRRRLVQKLEYLLLDSELPEEPDQAVLSEWIDGHRQQYELPATATFTHVYFRIDNGDVAAARARALAVLEQPQPITPALGDRFALQSAYGQQSPAAVRQQFGQSEFADAVFSVTPDQWSGPFQSGYGIHLLQVSERQPAYLPPYEDIAAQAASDWQAAEKQRRYEQKLADLMSRYTIERQR